MSEQTKYTREQVAIHNTENDLWVIVGKNVYNLTGFANEHPGGPDPLLEMGGKDATDLFESVSSHVDPQIAKYIETKIIGVLTDHC